MRFNLSQFIKVLTLTFILIVTLSATIETLESTANKDTVPTSNAATESTANQDTDSVPKINYSCICDPDTEYKNDIPKRIYEKSSSTVEEALKEIAQACEDLKPGEQEIKLLACFCKKGKGFKQCP